MFWPSTMIVVKKTKQKTTKQTNKNKQILVLTRVESLVRCQLSSKGTHSETTTEKSSKELRGLLLRWMRVPRVTQTFQTGDGKVYYAFWFGNTMRCPRMRWRMLLARVIWGFSRWAEDYGHIKRGKHYVVPSKFLLWRYTTLHLLSIKCS